MYSSKIETLKRNSSRMSLGLKITSLYEISLSVSDIVSRSCCTPITPEKQAARNLCLNQLLVTGFVQTAVCI